MFCCRHLLSIALAVELEVAMVGPLLGVKNVGSFVGSFIAICILAI